MANLDFLRAEGCDPKNFIWSRRSIVTLAGWGAVLGSLGAGTLAFGRFMYPRVLFEPRTQVKVGKPAEYAVNTVSDKWIKQFRLWLIRSEAGFVALSARCTHLGCTPRYLEQENKFKCPCHGSGFSAIDLKQPYPGIGGMNFEGPAPRPLERFWIGLAEDGQILVDFGKLYAFEKGDWEKPDSFLKYAG
jgi:cytochrome b6-f complex iron-sulfur subunit